MTMGDVVQPQEGHMARSGNERSMSNIFGAEGLPKIFLVLIASIVLFIQAWIDSGQEVHSSNVGYAIAVGFISLGLTMGFLGFGKYKTDQFVTKTVKVQGTTYTLPQMYAAFLMIWWGFGAFILTFYG